MGEIKLPYSVAKRLLVSDSGLRSNGPSVDKFSSKVLEFAEQLAKASAEKTFSAKRKTIFVEDIE
jgi:histone H3/H4